MHLLQGSGFSRAQDDSFTVHDYILSRDALKELDTKLKVRDGFAAEIGRLLQPLSRPAG